MKYGKHWSISNSKKQEYIDRLLPQLSSLRAKAGLSQDELSSLVGISRQTYCLTESGARGMSWNTYLSIIMFFDYNMRTHDLIRRTGVFPKELFHHFNPGEEVAESQAFDRIPEMNSMFDSLDENGKNMVRIALSSEYARCQNLSKEKSIQMLIDILK